MSAQKNDEQGLLLFHKNNKHDPTTIKILERADDYVAVGEDAVQVAQIVYKTASALKKVTDDVSIVTLNASLLSNFLKDALQNLGLRVQIYGSAAGSRSNWQLKKQASPGNLEEVEDLMGSGYDQKPVIVGINVGSSTNSNRLVGVSFLDSGSRQLGLSQFEDNDLFSNFESLLIQLGVKEAIVSDDSNIDTKKLKALMERLDILVTTRKPGQFSAKDVDQDIERLTGKTRLELSRELAMNVAIGAAGSIIKYLGLMSHTRDYGGYEIITHDLSQYMRLDASAIKALNIMPTARDTAKTMSLYGLLNQCKTVAGSRLLGQWLKQPLMDYAEIMRRHDLVEAFINSGLARQELSDHFHVVPDLIKIVRKFHKGVAKLEDVVRIYQVVTRLPDFITTLENLGESQAAVAETYLGGLNHARQELAKLVELVETTVDLTAIDNNEYVVNADFDDRLLKIKERKDALRKEITDIHLDAADTLGQEADKKLKLEDHHVYGWCFRLTRTDAGCLRNHMGFSELSTQKAGVYFTNRELKQRNEEFTDLDAQYRKAQSALVREVVDISSSYAPVLGPLSETLAHLDVIVSFAEASTFARLPYVRPKMHARHTGNIVLKQARHPCMEAQDDIIFIPNDVSLIRGESEFLIITGPNMGGKSTYIRQIGVISLMAQVGCFVPCEEAELAIVDCVLARVGAGDSQLKGISTFMAEMLETASILKTATKESLIVIDELGRGTSTYDGFGLAWAISQHVIENIGCFSLFATHFHELTALANKYPQAQNLHVVANSSNSDDITLLYQVAPGISDKSFGIHVAEVVNFPQKVIRMAKRKAQELDELEGDASLSQDQIEQGTAMLQQTLKKWAAGAAGKDSSTAIKELRDAIEQERSTFEAQPFLSQVLSSL